MHRLIVHFEDWLNQEMVFAPPELFAEIYQMEKVLSEQMAYSYIEPCGFTSQ